MMISMTNADQNRDDKVSRGNNNITPIKIRKVIPKTEDRRDKTTSPGNHHHQRSEEEDQEDSSPQSRSRSMTEDDDKVLLNSRGQSPRRNLQFTTATSNNSREGSSVASSEEDLQVANGERIRGESSSSGNKNENDSDENPEERTNIINNGGESKQQNQGIKSNVVQRMGRCSSTSSMISSTAKTDEYGLQTKPCTVARLDGYCYGFPVDERKEKAYSKARKQLMKQKDRASESYARYSKARKVWKEAKRTSGSSGSSVTNVTNSAINEALNQCQREVARNGLPEKKRAKAWLDALSVKSKRDNCEKTYEEYSQLSERERFDRERASVRVDLINVFPDHPRYSLGAIDSMKERKEEGEEEEEEGGEEDQKIQHELVTESLDRLRSSSARGQSSMTSSGNESSSGGEMYSNSASPRFSQHQNHIQAMNSFGETFVGSPPRSPHGLRGFKKEDDEEGVFVFEGDALKRTTSSESDGTSNDRDDTADTTKEEPQNAIMQLLTGSFFEKLNMFPARVSSIKEEEGREGKKKANNNNNDDDDEDEEEDDEDQFRLPENYMDSTSLQYFGKMERVLMAFSARSPRDLEKSHVVAAAMSLLVFKGNEENAFWTLVCLAEDVNLFLDEAEVTTETIVLEERTRHNSSLERVHTNLVGKIFTRIGAGFFPPNVVLRILDAIILSPPPLSSRLLHHIAYEFLFHHGEKLKDEERTLEIATEAFDCDELIINGMKMMSATETMKSNLSLRILARQRVERSSGGFCGPDKGWSVSLVSAKRMKDGDVSSKKKKMFVPTSGWSSDEDEAIRKATRSCDFFGHFSPLRNRRKSQDDFLREEEKKQQSRSVQEVVNEINESGSELERKKSEDPLMMTLSPVKTIPSQDTLNESADIMRYKFVIRGPNDVTCTMYRNRADLVRLHEILCERKITAQLSMLRLPKSFTNKLTAGITKTGFNESQEYFVRLSKAGVPGLQKVFEEFFELDSPDLNEYCYESDDTQGSFDDY